MTKGRLQHKFQEVQNLFAKYIYYTHFIKQIFAKITFQMMGLRFHCKLGRNGIRSLTLSLSPMLPKSDY